MAERIPDFVDVPDYIEDEIALPGSPASTVGEGVGEAMGDPLAPLQSGTTKWRITKVLGKGCSAVVYLATSDKGKTVAVKVIHLPDRQERILQEVERIKKEITALRVAGGHRNVVVYYHFHAQGTRVNMFFEYCPQGTLWRKFTKEGPISAEVAARYTRHITNGLAWVHKNGVVHRDLKCLNILVGSGDVAKLTDFGSAAIIGAFSQHSVVGTLLWMAPEVVLRNGHRWQADIWSLGCTVIEMMTAAKPFVYLFEGKEYQNPLKIAAMHQGMATVPAPNIDPLAQDFVMACLVKDRQARPSADQLLLHPFLAKTRKQKTPTATAAAAAASPAAAPPAPSPKPK